MNLDCEKIIDDACANRDMNNDRLTIAIMKEAIKAALPEILQIVADNAKGCATYSPSNGALQLVCWVDKESILSLESEISKKLGL